ncbi:hypothetical protein [Nostoc sp.]
MNSNLHQYGCDAFLVAIKSSQMQARITFINVAKIPNLFFTTDKYL